MTTILFTTLLIGAFASFLCFVHDLTFLSRVSLLPRIRTLRQIRTLIASGPSGRRQRYIINGCCLAVVAVIIAVIIVIMTLSFQSLINYFICNCQL